MSAQTGSIAQISGFRTQLLAAIYAYVRFHADTARVTFRGVRRRQVTVCSRFFFEPTGAS